MAQAVSAVRSVSSTWPVLTGQPTGATRCGDCTSIGHALATTPDLAREDDAGLPPCNRTFVPPEHAASTHAPCRGRLENLVAVSSSMQFRSTPPCRGRPRLARSATSVTGFDPRPRAGGDLLRLDLGVGDQVSIHAPVQGATTWRQGSRGRQGVSIHAPVQGATRHVGRAWRHVVVSIHAPVQGATPCRSPWSGPDSRFDPRPRAGGDQPVAPRCGRWTGFDPRPRAGGDHPAAGRHLCPSCFDPRPRAGGDPAPGVPVLAAFWFRSTPPCRGRLVHCAKDRHC